jgi:hypothetical protein
LQDESDGEEWMVRKFILLALATACGGGPASSVKAAATDRFSSVAATAIAREYGDDRGHFYTAANGEGAPAFRVEYYPYFYVAARELRDSLPLRRCYRSAAGGGLGRHIATTRPDCEGASEEGLLGYVAQRPRLALTGLLEWVHESNEDQLLTIDPNERPPHYQLRGLIGYVSTTLNGFDEVAPQPPERRPHPRTPPRPGAHQSNPLPG